MKNLLKITLLSLLTSLLSFSQDTIQVGGVRNKIRKEKLENATLRVWYEFTQRAENKDSLLTSTDTMALVLGNNYSIYYDWNRKRKTKEMAGLLSGLKFEELEYTTFHRLEQRMTESSRLIEYKNVDGSEILKNRKSGVITTSDSEVVDLIYPIYYMLEEKIPPQEWELHQEEWEILGYTCNKATCTFRGREYTAWYTLDIPINDGPYKFYGLPGLILMIEDSEKIFQFKAIGLKQLNNVELVTENKDNFTKCSFKQYSEIKKRMRETLYLFYPIKSSLLACKRYVHWPFSSIEID